MNDNVNQLIGYNLKVARIRNDWSQAFVSNLTGLSIRSISRAETGHSVSKSTLKRLCALYHMDISSLYEPVQEEKKIVTDFVPENIALGLLIKNSFISDLQREVILRFSHSIRKDALMQKEDIEALLPKIIGNKTTVTVADVIRCCMMVNQQTIHNITDMAVA